MDRFVIEIVSIDVVKWFFFKPLEKYQHNIMHNRSFVKKYYPNFMSSTERSAKNMIKSKVSEI
jgi:hypothetical protein